MTTERILGSIRLGEVRQLFQRDWIRHRDDAFLDLDDAAALPSAGTLVDALAACPADVAELALRKLNLQHSTVVSTPCALAKRSSFLARRVGNS